LSHKDAQRPVYARPVRFQPCLRRRSLALNEVLLRSVTRDKQKGSASHFNSRETAGAVASFA
jgi:hypothetical protein